MSEELAREIEAGEGTDDAVALALGWVDRHAHRWWRDPDGNVKQIPAFLTDLNALAAECERQKRGWSIDITDEGVSSWVDTHDGWDAAEGRVPAEPGLTPSGKQAARALCAALVRAAGETR